MRRLTQGPTIASVVATVLLLLPLLAVGQSKEQICAMIAQNGGKLPPGAPAGVQMPDCGSTIPQASPPPPPPVSQPTQTIKPPASTYAPPAEESPAPPPPPSSYTVTYAAPLSTGEALNQIDSIMMALLSINVRLGEMGRDNQSALSAYNDVTVAVDSARAALTSSPDTTLSLTKLALKLLVVAIKQSLAAL